MLTVDGSEKTQLVPQKQRKNTCMTIILLLTIITVGGGVYHGMINGGHVIDTAYGQASVPLVRNETAKLTASDAVADDRFGHSVSVYNNTAVIGAFYNDDNGTNSGSAYVFEKNSTSGNWTQTETVKLTANDAAADDRFGYSVSVYNNTAVISALYDDDNGTNSGSAYVFEKNSTSGNWTQTETVKLTASDAAAGDYFGRSVSVYNNTAVIGAFLDNDNGTRSGSAYVFEKNSTSGNWTQTETVKLTANDGAVNDYFGHSVSVYNNTAVIGAYLDDDNGTNSGSAYVFEKNSTSGNWTQTETVKLTANDAAADDWFGYSVSVYNNIAVIGAHLDDDNGLNSGSAYVFEKNSTSGNWTQTETVKLTANDGVAGDYFGYSVSVYNNTAVIGAYQDDDNSSNSGSAYVFEKNSTSGNWTQTETVKLTASDAAVDDRFGHSVSVYNNTAVIGAYQDDDNGFSSGSAYVFSVDTTSPTLQNVTISSNNTNSTLAADGDTVTLSFTASELIKDVTATIANATATVSGSDTSWNATRTLDGTEPQGALPFTIDFDDLAGNPGAQVNATTDLSSVTFDQTAPVALSTVSISSDNSNSTLAKPSDVVTVSFTAPEELSITPTVTIDGNQADSVTGGPTDWSATRAMQAGDAESAVAFTIDFTDDAGNSGPQATATTDLSSVTFDQTAPVALSTVSISSDNSNSTLAKPSDVVTVSFTAPEELSITPTVTIDGNQADSVTGGPTDWSATRAMQAGDAESAVAFTIDFTDDAGNSGPQATATTDLSSVTFDQTAPTLNAVSISSNNTNSTLAADGDTVTLSFTASELIKDVTATIANATATVSGSDTSWNATRTLDGTEPQGALPFTIDFDDLAGNPGAQVNATTDLSSVTFDQTAPVALSTVSISSDNSNSTLAKPSDVVTVSFTAPEELSITPTVTIDGNQADSVTGGPTDWSATRAMQAGDAESAVAFTIDFTDDAGNSGPQATATTDLSSVTFDQTAPVALSTVSISSDNSNSTLAKPSDVVTVSFTAPEELSITPTVTIDGNQADSVTGGPTDWSATRAMQAGDAESAVAFTIDFTDDAGNSGPQATATTDLSSVTFDQTAPTLNAVSISSNNTNSTLAADGDTVTLSFTASELIKDVTATIANATATVSGSDTSWNATRTLDGTEPQGALPFTIDFDDLAGNPGAQVNATTDLSSVTFDQTAPVALSTVSISSDNSNSTLAKPSDVVTVSFTAPEELSITPTVTIDGNQADSVTGGPTDWSATRAMQAGDAESAVAFTIDFTDDAGNSGPQATATTDLSSVTFDQTAPVALSTVSISSDNSNSTLAKPSDVVTVSFTAPEELSITPTVTIDGNQADSVTGGPTDWSATRAMQAGDAESAVAFTIDFTDDAGNSGPQATATTDLSSVTFDQTAPTLNAVSISSNNTNSTLAADGDTVTLSFTASELIKDVTATIANATATVSGSDTSWNATRTLDGTEPQGALPFTIDFDDLAGNPGAQVNATTDLSSVTFDQTAPVALSTVSISSDNSNSTLAKPSDVVTVSFTAPEELSITPTVTIDGNQADSVTGGPTDWSATRAMQAGDAESAVAFTIDFTDDAGNSGPQATATTDLSSVTFDQTAPVALSTVSISSDNSNSTLAKPSDVVTVSFTAPEELSITPTVTIDGNQADSVTGGPTDWSATRAMQAGDAESAVAFTIDFTDDAGNSGPQATATTDLSSVTFDQTAPVALSTVSISSDNSNSTLAKPSDVVTVSFTAPEELSITPTVTIDGNQADSVTGGPTDWSATRAMQAGDAESAVAFTIDFTDDAGNSGPQATATTDLSSVTFDQTAPVALSTVSISSDNSNSTLAKPSDVVTVSFTAPEELSITPTVTIDGNQADSVTGGPTDWSATRAMQAGDAESAVAFTIDFTDDAGNSGPQATATTDLSSVTFDQTAPVALSTVSISSDNSNSTLAKPSDVVTVSFTAPEELSITPTVTIDGNQADSVTGGPTDWSATRAMQAGDAESAVAFTIDFTDDAGNSGPQATATTDLSSVTFDQTAPVALSTVSISSDNSNSTLAKPSDVVTVSFTAPEELSITPTVTIDGNQADSVTGGPTDWSATRAMQAGDAESAVAFTIDFTDDAGNSGPQATATTDLSSVTFDQTAPTLNAVSISSNNTNSTLAADGDTVTLSFTASELIKDVTATIANATATVSGSDTSWNATRTLDGTEPQGALPFTIDFDDLAGNPGAQVNATTDLSSVTFDQTAPVALSTVSISSDNSNSTLAKPSDVVTVSFTAPEELSITPTVTIDGNQADSVTGGPTDWSATRAMQAGDAESAVAFTIDFTDDAGNSGPQATATTDLSSVTFDQTAPVALSTVSISSDNSNSTLAKPSDVVTVSFTAPEELSITPTVTIDGNQADSVTGGPTDWSATRAMQAGDAESAVAFTIDFTDDAGNSGPQATATTDLSSVTFDQTAPVALSTVSISSDNSNSTLAKPSDVVTVSFTAPEELSITPTVTIDGNQADSVTGGPTDWSATRAMQAGDAESAVAFTIDFTDDAGNSGPQATATTDLSSVTFDQTAPVALSTVSISSDNSNSTLAKPSDVVTVSFTAPEELSITPTVTIDGNQADSVTGGPTDWSATRAMQAGDAESAVAFTIDFTDDAGNSGPQATATTDLSSVTFDQTAPVALSTVSISSDNSNSTLAKPSDVVTVSFTAPEELSITPTVTIDGNQADSVTGGPTDWSATRAMQAGDAESAVAFTIDFTDDAGNSGPQATATTDLSSVTFDQTAPVALSTVSISSDNSNSTLAKPSDVVTVSFTAPEELSITPTVTIDGNQADSVTGGPTDWSATRAMQAGDAESAVAFTIDFTDDAGNSGPQATATTDLSSVTFDQTAPVALSTVSISSDNSNSTLAKPSDVVTVSFTAPEELSITPTVTIDGNQADSVTGGPTDWSATRAMQAGDAESAVAFTIDFTDDAGNSGPQATATTDLSSVTFDQTAPVALSTVSISSDNSNSTLAKPSDVVTVSFTAPEELSITPTVTIDGNQADSVTGGPTDWSATRAMQAGDAESAVAFTIDFTDDAGNSGPQATATTDLSSVTFDQTAPVALSTVSISSDNSNSTLAKPSDVVTVSFTAPEELSITPTVTIDGNQADSVTGGPTDWSATRAMQAGDAESAVAFTIDFTDDAGNSGPQATATTDLSSVTFDQTAPVALSTVSISSDNSNSTLAKPSDVVTVSFTAPEELSITPTVTIDGNQADSVTGGPTDWSATRAMQAGDAESAVAFTIDFTDDAGNSGPQATATTDLSSVTFDQTAPVALSTVSISSDNSNSTLAKPSDVVTVSFTAPEELSITPTVTIDGNQADSVTGGPTDWSATRAMQAGDAESAVAFTIDFTDDAGNSGPQATATTDLSSVTFDQTAPTLNAVSISSDNSNSTLAKPSDVVTVSFTAPEELSITPTVTIDGNQADSVTGGPTDWSATRAMQAGDAESAVAFTIDFTDDAGNSGPQATATTDLSSVTFDQTAPVALSTVSISSDNSNSTLAKPSDVVTVSFTAPEELSITPTVTIDGNQADSVTGGPTDWSATRAMQAGDAESAVAFTIDFTDDAGNSGPQATATTDLSSVTFDQTAPVALSTVSISSDNSNSTLAKPSDVVTVSFTAPEELSITPTVTIDGNQADSVTGGPTDWSATRAMQAGDAESAVAFTIDFTDDAGNSGPQATATTDLSSVTFDQTAPTLNAVSISSDNSNNSTLAAVGDTVTLSFTGSEEIKNVMATIGGLDANATVYEDGISGSVTRTLNGTESEGVSLPFTIDFDDLAGTPGAQVTAITGGPAVTVDFTAPTPVITTTATGPTSLEPIPFTVDFGETMQSGQFAAAEIMLSSGSVTGFGASDDQLFAFNVTGAADNANLTVDVAANVAQDLAGNDNTAADRLSIAVNRTAPTLNSVTISSSNANSTLAANGDIVTLYFTASESIKDVTATIGNYDATVQNSTAVKWTAALTLNKTTHSSLNGISPSFTIDFADLAGTPRAQVTAITGGPAVTVDFTAPTPVITTTATGPTSLEPIPFTVDFGETMQSGQFAAAEIMLSSGSVTGFGASDDQLFAFNVTGAADNANLTVDVAANVAQDLAGNDNTAADRLSIAVNRTAPTLNSVTISSSNANSTLAANGDIVTLYFTASESIKDVTATIGNYDATVQNSTAVKWTAALTLNKTTHSSLNGISPSFTIDFADLAGTPRAQVTAITGGPAVTVDFTAPTPVITTTATGPTSLEPIPFTVDFGETMQSGQFAAAEIMLSSGSVTGFGASDDQLFAFNVTGAADNANLTVDVAVNVAQDLAGNDNTAADRLSIAVNRTAPTLNSVTISSSNANSTLAANGDIVTLYFTASESIKDVTATIGNYDATVQNSTAVKWTAALTLNKTTHSSLNGISPSFTIDFADLAGTPRAQVTAITGGPAVTVDFTAPTPVITTTATGPTSLEPIPFTVDFGETMQSGQFAAAEIMLSSGSVTGFGASDDQLFAFNVTGAADNANLTVDVAVNVAQDLAGNDNTAADRLSIAVNRTAPTLNSVTISSSNANSTLAANGDIVTLYFTASESIKDVTATIGNAAATVSGSGTSWNATRTLDGTEPQGALSFTINFDDLAGNPGVQISATTDTVDITVLDTDDALLTFPGSPPGSSGSGGGGGGGGGGSSSSTWVDDIYLKSVSWDCNAGTIKIIAGPDSDYLSVSVRTTQLGVHQASIAGDDIPGYRAFVSNMDKTEDYIGIKAVALHGRDSITISESINITECTGERTFDEYMQPESTLPSAVTQTEEEGQETIFDSPLYQQLKGNIPAEMVQCNEGLVLVLKPNMEESACVRESTAHKLVMRGWHGMS